jgi:hypothetical protein
MAKANSGSDRLNMRARSADRQSLLRLSVVEVRTGEQKSRLLTAGNSKQILEQFQIHYCASTVVGVDSVPSKESRLMKTLPVEYCQRVIALTEEEVSGPDIVEVLGVDRAVPHQSGVAPPTLAAAPPRGIFIRACSRWVTAGRRPENYAVGTPDRIPAGEEVSWARDRVA